MATRNDWLRLRDCTAELYRWEGDVPFPEHCVRVMKGLIDAAVVAYQAFDFRAKTTVLQLSDRESVITENEEAFYAHLHQHPLINKAREADYAEALRISDLMAWPEFQETGLFREFYQKVGLGHQMAVSLPARSGDVIGLVFTRDEKDRDFSDEEAELLNMLRWHVVQALQVSRRTGALMERIHRMEGMLEAVGEGVLALDAELRIGMRTRRAAEILERHFGWTDAQQLPENLRRWVVRQVSPAAAEGPRVEVRVRTMRGMLDICLLWRDGGWVLILEEPQSLRTRLSCEKLRPLGLTKRETEVLRWISLGKTNSEIGMILGSRPRTVQKHVERILRKLHVENRGAAALRAMELSL